MQEAELTRRGLERRVKRHLTGQSQSFAAITTPGFEPYTRNEIAAQQGAVIGNVEKGVVEFTGPFDLVYATNLHCRTASRILLRIDEFTARSYPELYNKLCRINWEVYTGFASSVFFCASSMQSRLHHTDRIAETAHSALRNHMEPMGLTVASEKSAAIRFFIRFIDDICTISIDASGELLYKRGLRRATGRAPLRETTAAALLAAVQWEKYDIIADPCCGTGSIIIEALQRRYRLPPGLMRDFAFFSWPAFSRPAWEHLKSPFGQLTDPPSSAKPQLLYAGDTDPTALASLKTNCASFPAEERLKIMHADCLKFNEHGEYGCHGGLVLSNLPYGKRIGFTESALDEFYGNLGRSLKRYCHGWDFAFLVADPHFERTARLDGATILAFMNGGIRVRLVKGRIG